MKQNLIIVVGATLLLGLSLAGSIHQHTMLKYRKSYLLGTLMMRLSHQGVIFQHKD